MTAPHEPQQDRPSRTATQHDVDINHYTYRVQWDGASERFIASVAELPGTTFASESQLEAFVGIRTAADAEVRHLREAGEEIPTPLTERRYSGRLLLRIPPELHRRLTIEAAEQHVSLNRLISNRLAEA